MFKNREQLMAFAIIGVVFYHLALRGIPIGRLNVGYMGVDVFILLSGFGIGKSLSHNSIGRFYQNRARRILPVWTLMIFLSWLLPVIGGGKLWLQDLIFNLTTLSFYFNPDLLPEWYLATLLLFYALSPFLYRFLKLTGWYGVAFVSIAAVLLEVKGWIPCWQYDNAICRFPLFLLGMQCAIKNRDNLSYYVTIPCFAIGCYFFFQGFHYLFSSWCVLLLIPIVNTLIDKCSLLKASIIKNIGRHTLEIYAANVISAVFITSFLCLQESPLVTIASDIALTVLGAIFLSKWNKLILSRL